MNIPTDLKYTESHEWVRREADGTLTVGITDFAQDALGDIVFVELPQVGKTFTAGDDAAVVESVKAASDIYAPVGGTVTEVNQSTADAPDSINRRLRRLAVQAQADDAGAINGLLDADAYGKTTGTDFDGLLSYGASLAPYACIRKSVPIFPL
jgi:glycine cleavage system H protein